MWWYLIIVLICASLTTVVEHLSFVYLLVFCGKVSVQIICPFYLLGFFLIVGFLESLICFGYNSFTTHVLYKRISPNTCYLFCQCLNIIFWMIEVRNFDKVQFISLFSHGSYFLLCFFLEVYDLGFIFRSVIYFELICVYGARYGSNFILHIDIQLFQHSSLKTCKRMQCTRDNCFPFLTSAVV